MIVHTTGDVLAADAEAIVNTVNCVGVMGRGIALQFKRAWPDNFKAYADACRREEVRPGRMFIFETGRLTNPKLIINFPTKRHWRGRSRMEDIESGLAALVSEVRRRNVRSIAIPPLGAGLGGLDWADVRARIEGAFQGLDEIRVLLFAPSGAPATGPGIKAPTAPPMTPGRASLIGLMDRYLSGLLDPFVSLLEVHKLMYFMQAAGEPLRLKFTKGPYGPYAENLRHVLHAIEGHYVSGYGTGGDAPDKTLELLPGAVAEATSVLETQPGTRARFEQVSRLVAGFESPFGLELLATVHWLQTNEHPESLEELVRRTYAWGDRKRRFQPQQIALAERVLREQSWNVAAA